MRVHFFTHPEAEIDPGVPVNEWRLNELGSDRAGLLARALTSAGSSCGGVWSSPEAKAEQTANVIGGALGAPVVLVDGLAELDRGSTGYLAEPEFWANYEDFLALPTASARGWETAEAAQCRIAGAIDAIVEAIPKNVTEGGQAADAGSVAGNDLVVVSHGGVGALLLCQLRGMPIQRLVAQPGQGSYFCFDAESRRVLQGWQSFEEFAAS